MTVLVTGGTGFVGSAVVRALVERGDKVRVLARRTSKVDELTALGVEIAYGDLLDQTSIEAALAGCDTLYHVAAIYELWVQDKQKLIQTAVDGTRNAMEAAHKTGVSKVVYTSTSATIGAAKGEVGTETTPHRGYFLSAYEEAKHKAEQVAWEYVEKGVPIVIVNPAAVYGPGDLKSTGQGLIDVVNGRAPFLYPMSWSTVYIDDVARGHLLAAEKGEVGQRYIFSERVVTGEKFFRLVCSLTDTKAPPTFPAPAFLPLVWAGEAIARFTRRPPLVSYDQFRTSTHGTSVDGAKAIRELGLQYTPLEEGLPKALAWYWEQGLIKHKPISL
jgi:dihydroflavonol-4-reductase